MGSQEHSDIQGEQSPLGTSAGEGRGFWKPLRVRSGVRIKGQKVEQVHGWGLDLASGPVPWTPSQRSPKGLRFWSSLLGPRDLEESSPRCLSCLCKDARSHPSLRARLAPWAEQPCLPAHPRLLTQSRRNLSYQTGSPTCQASPMHSGPPQPRCPGGCPLVPGA